MLTSKTFLSMSAAAAIVVAPMLALGQAMPVPNEARGGMSAQAPTDGTPGNPPGTAVGRAIDRATTATPTAPAPVATPPGLAVDGVTLRNGRRASEIIGSNIYNEDNDSIGEVDDLIVRPGGDVPVAVISVGGFLGIGAKLVAIPYDRLTHDAQRNRWMLRGASKDSLKSLPSFSYDSAARRG